MPTTFRAQMSVRGGRWRLYVVLLGTTERWPEFSFGRRSVPTLAERSRALKRLGFEPVEDGEWSWSEDSEIVGDPTTAVILIATTQVRSRAGVDA
ncbi:DUF6303 family protein [Streptomyces sp. NPDC047028]|uniref:DUF6303 family protein n=1 Tax=Streptomyces sp. NPDC047028 TaxID=3155793 RepID=UPI0033F540B1